MWVGFSQSVEGLHRTKKVNPLQSRRKLILSDFELGHQFFSCLQIQMETPALLGSQVRQPSDSNYTVGSTGSQAYGLGLKLYYRLPWVSSLPFTLQTLGLASLHNHLGRSFLIINQSINQSISISLSLIRTHTHTPYWFCFSGEHWLIQLSINPLKQSGKILSTPILQMRTMRPRKVKPLVRLIRVHVGANQWVWLFASIIWKTQK